MKRIKEQVGKLIDLIYAVKDKNLRWRLDHNDQLTKLSHDRILADKDLSAQLTRKSMQLAHEIELLEIRQTTELTMLKTRCNEDVKDYQQYLAALNQLKKDIQVNFAHLPDALAHTIHHHAKTLLNAMWEASDFEEKTKLESRLIQFMSTVHEEGLHHRSGKQSESLPENTLRLITEDKNQTLPH
jgi:hypothetical protein